MDADELREALRRDREEKGLDFKGPMKWNERGDKRGCCELVKDILAMANTYGGDIVVGVEEHLGETPRYTPKGLTEQEVTSFESTRIGRFVNGYAAPPANVSAHPIELDGKRYMVIHVREFPDAPHVCVKDYPDVLRQTTVYVRTDANESAPIGSAADMHALLERATRKRAGQIAEVVHAVLTGQGGTPGPAARTQFESQLAEAEQAFCGERPAVPGRGHGYRGAAFFPSAHDPTRWTLEEILDALTTADAPAPGTPWTRLSQGIEKHATADGYRAAYGWDQPFSGFQRFLFWDVRQSGSLFHRDLMWEDGEDRQKDRGPHMGIASTTCYVARAIDTMVRFYDELGLEDEFVTLGVGVEGIQGRSLLIDAPNRVPLFYECTSHIPSFFTHQTLALSVWRGGRARLAAEMTSEILTRFNWDAPNKETLLKDAESALSGSA